MRYTASEKLEIIRLVERSSLPMRSTGMVPRRLNAWRSNCCIQFAATFSLRQRGRSVSYVRWASSRNVSILTWRFAASGSSPYSPGRFDTGSYGAGGRIRTADPRITNALLYRLSYTGYRHERGAHYPAYSPP